MFQPLERVSFSAIDLAVLISYHNLWFKLLHVNGARICPYAF